MGYIWRYVLVSGNCKNTKPLDIKKNKYLIYSTTFWCWILQYFIGMIVPTVILIIAEPGKYLIPFFISMLLLNVLLRYIARRYLLQPIEITLTEDRIHLKYLNLNLTKTKKDLSTTIQKISGFSDFTVNQESKFKLYFSQGQTFTLHKHLMWSRKDDFELLINDFKTYIENLNEKPNIETYKTENIRIKYGDSTYLYFGLFSLTCALIMGLALIFSESNGNTKLLTLLGFLVFLAVGLFNIFRDRNSNEKIND